MSYKYNLKQKILKNLEKRIENYINRKKIIKSGNKKVEFYLMDAFEIFHFLPIYNALVEEGVDTNFVCEPNKIHTARQWFDYDTAIKILDSMQLRYTLCADSYARIVFTTQQAWVLSKYYGIKINLNYGCGFNKANFGNTPESAKGFDYKFVHGKYMYETARKTLRKNQIKIIGYPKHDKYFKNPPNKNEIIQNLGIKTEKPILVYFPTWDGDSSIQKFGDEINKLRKDFYVVTKAHHCTFRLDTKKDDLKKLYMISDKVLEGNSNFSDAAVIADIALIDGKSGSSCEVPYLNINLPIVYLSPRDNVREYFKANIFEFGEFVNLPENLIEKVNNVYKNDVFIPIRKEKIQYYLGLNDGNSTQRAIEEIKKILK